MISYNVDGGTSPFEVVLPPCECIVYLRKLLVVDIIIGLGVLKHLGVEHDRMVVACN